MAETFKDFPISALSLLESLLAIEPEARGTASSALQSDVRIFLFLFLLEILLIKALSIDFLLIISLMLNKILLFFSISSQNH